MQSHAAIPHHCAKARVKHPSELFWLVVDGDVGSPSLAGHASAPSWGHAAVPTQQPVLIICAEPHSPPAPAAADMCLGRSSPRRAHCHAESHALALCRADPRLGARAAVLASGSCNHFLHWAYQAELECSYAPTPAVWPLIRASLASGRACAGAIGPSSANREAGQCRRPASNA